MFFSPFDKTAIVSKIYGQPSYNINCYAIGILKQLLPATLYLWRPRMNIIKHSWQYQTLKIKGKVKTIEFFDDFYIFPLICLKAIEFAT